MAFTSVRLYNFRNLIDTTVDTDAREVFLVGENGQGKTNFLEAIYFVCYASSFRTRRDDVIRTIGRDEMAVAATFTSDDGPHAVRVKQTGRTKEIELDGKAIADRKEIVANVPCIVFCHDDIAFVAGAPDMQRWFMNQTQSLLEPDVIAELRRYNRILKARNAALRDGRTELLDALDEQLIAAGIPIQTRRAALTARFSTTLATLFARIFDPGHTLTLAYRPSWGVLEGGGEATLGGGASTGAVGGTPGGGATTAGGVATPGGASSTAAGAAPDRAHGASAPANAVSPAPALREQLLVARARDIEMRTTTRGPHRDRYPFKLDGRTLTEVASTGQLRLVSLILRVAQAQLLADVTGRQPVLLLDDVLLELDPARRSRFVDALPEYEQAFFTFLPDEQYARFRKHSTRTYRVQAGGLAES